MENEPDYILDLHGKTTSECKFILDDIIESEDYEYIRIIIGRGLNSPNGPVLPYFIKNYLNSKDIKFTQSKKEDGGEGALEVFLK